MNQKSILFTLIVLTGLIFSDRATAQTFKTLYQFTAVDTNDINRDGAGPFAGLTASGNILYGTTSGGGKGGSGTVFSVKADGTGFTNLYTFTTATLPSHLSTVATNSDGGGPEGRLVLLGNTLYGTAAGGGSNGFGTIFGVNTDGTGFTNLYTFSRGSNGFNPRAGLIASGGTLYGTTFSDGSGTIFRINTDGTGFTNLHSFNYGSDGGDPSGELLLSGNTLYGMASSGGIGQYGTIFAVNTDGTGFTNLYTFTGGAEGAAGADGGNPARSLILSGGRLYGTTAYGGSNEFGTVFAINTDGTGFTNLYSFYTTMGNYILQGEMTLSGNTLYGTGSYGGAHGTGTVFAINTDGTGFTNIHSFSTLDPNGVNNKDGAEPMGGVALLGNTLYGTTSFAGSGGEGTIYSLTISPSATNTISVSASPSAGGAVSGGGTFASDGVDTVTATNNTYYTFDGWTVNGTNVSTNASYSFTLTGDIALVANFDQAQYTIGVSALPEAGGTVDGGGTFGGGSTNTVSALANSGYLFKSWTTNGVSVSTLTNYSFTLKADETLVANFTQITNTISVIASPVAGGTVTGSGKIAQGGLCMVTASPKTGYSFSGWTVKGINVSNSQLYSFTTTGNEALVANFTQIKYTIAVSSSSSTEGTVSGGGVFVPGGSHTVKATAKHGFKFVNWTVNGTPVSTSASYTFVLNANETLVANFQPLISP
jgi:uncharacterized repeat protein (TIGR03803 family)